MTNIPVTDRVNWVGASEVAALPGIDCSPYMTGYGLYAIKAGLIQAEPLEGDRIDAGNFFEPAIAAWASKKWDWKIRRHRDYLRHPTIARMGASLDYTTEPGSPVEIKNVDGLIFRDQWQCEGEEIIEPPLHIALQLQWQMACANEPMGWIVACVGGNRLVRGLFNARPKIQEAIATHGRAFWHMVDNKTPPAIDYLKDVATIAAIHQDASGEPVDLSFDNRAVQLCAEYTAAAAHGKAADEAKAAAKAELLEKIGAARSAVIGDFKVSASAIAPKLGTMITAEMVGTTINARKGYRDFRVTEKVQK